MAKARKFVSRKKRKEIQEQRERRQENMVREHQRFQAEQSSSSTTGEKQIVQIPESATVGEFAEILGLPVVRVISQLMKNGIMAAITARIDFDTMAIVADELGYTAEAETAAAPSHLDGMEVPAIEGKSVRPPVVTIMGHVDHGKTSLLDYIRKAKVAAGEHGGITQHIGAYQAEVEYEGKDRTITFLDTPGHEAFTALRSHGAQVTDIVVLVVAADDGIKPQTIEAINHAKSAGVPILVAITKIDLPSANIDRVKQQLVEHDLIPEEWGGKTIMTGVSSVTGDGIQQLLEYIVLTADLKNYSANPDTSAQGVVIESHQEVGLGPVATLLVQNGTLHVGDIVVLGKTYGKVRSMMNYRGERLEVATPSTPVKVSGLIAVPEFGDSFAIASSEKQARELVEKAATGSVRRGLSDISRAIAEGRTDKLKLVVKADTQGSIEALRAAITKIEKPGVSAMILHSGIGDVTLSDIQLAAASDAIVVGFQVSLPAPIKKSAQNIGVSVFTYKIIYDLLDQIEKIMSGLVRTTKIKVERGRLNVKKIFRATKDLQIVGGEITKGVALAKAFVRLERSGEAIAEGKMVSLQKGPEAVNELEAGQECGLSLSINEKLQPGDTIVFLVEEEVIAAEHETTE